MMREFLLMFLLVIMALFMILLVLIQRGRGGGLVGAFGGMGGQSAFGTKAGDLFTRVTMWTAAVWIILCAATTCTLNKDISKVQVQGQAPPPGRGENIAPPPPAEPVDDSGAKLPETPATDAKTGDSKSPVVEAPDAKPGESKPAAPAATDSKSGDTKASDTKPGEGKS